MGQLFASQRFLVIYSGVLTIVFAASLLAGFTKVPRRTSFEELDVHRINIVEPDGTLRMVISSKAAFPGIIVKGKESPHPNRKTAGMLFFNDEGTENGGLIFGGMVKDGTKTSSGHLSFDAYEQDQVLSIDSGQQGDKNATSITVIDRPSYPISEIVALSDRIKNMPQEKQKAEIAEFSKSHAPAHQRLFIGRNPDSSVALKLKDTEGRDRLVIEVAEDGTPVLRFLDASGKVVSQLPPSVSK